MTTPTPTPQDLADLLTVFSKAPYEARESNAKTNQILNRCLALMGKDYKCMVINNSTGELCGSYPSQLIIPECEKPPPAAATAAAAAAASTTTSSTDTLDAAPTRHAPPAHPSPLTLTSPLGTTASLPQTFSSVLRGGQTTSMCVQPSPAEVPKSERKASLPEGSNKAEAADAQSDGSKLRELILKAKFARCRARFPVPVILYRGNYISRSSTLAGGPEMYGRSGIEYLFTGAIPGKAEEQHQEEEENQGQLFDRVRYQDIRLLKAYSVGVIVDLMVEKKKVKYGMYVTSSEKVDKENRYSEFTIVSLPYPGCEFFREFRDSGYNAEGLFFNWNQAFMDAQLVIPDRNMARPVTSDWNNYRKWDLVKLTQNYLKLLLVWVHEGDEGLLVHCISGWDRTPLFVSLLRLSLWADGLIHPSLGPLEILYLTIAYDWFLFGHDLKDRLAKGEEIFFFCFEFLKYIASEEFALGRRRHPSSDSASLERVDIGVLLDTDGLSSAESSNSLNSSCSSNRSSHPPRYFRVAAAAGDGDQYGVHLTWPYGSDSGELDFDDMSPNLSRASSTSSRGLFGRSSFRDVEVAGASGSGECRILSRHTHATSHKGSSGSLADITRQTVTWTRGHNSESSGESATSDGAKDDLPRASTSPVAVPVPRGRMVPRPRQESGSSVGSWQIITTTGSLRGSPGSTSSGATGATGGLSSIGSAASRTSRSSVGCDMVDSATTIKEESGSSISSQLNGRDCKRLERLAKVRSIFYNQYVGSIGRTACNGRQETGLGTLVSNFAQKVGIKPIPNRST